MNTRTWHLSVAKPRRLHPVLVAILAVVLVAGCDLVSGTVRIVQDFNEGPQQSTGQNVKELGIDLSQNSDFNDHKDQIKSVDEVGFVFRAQNNLAEGATGEIWLSPTRISGGTPTADQIRAWPQAKRVLSGLVLPASAYLDVSYDQSLTYEENLAFLHDTVKTGTFYLYGIASTSNFDLTIDKLSAVVVLTVEL